MSESNTELEQGEIYAIRLKIGEQINAHRHRYGNKDGRAPDGSSRRYEELTWLQVENLLDDANGALFTAAMLLRKYDADKAATVSAP